MVNHYSIACMLQGSLQHHVGVQAALLSACPGLCKPDLACHAIRVTKSVICDVQRLARKRWSVISRCISSKADTGPAQLQTPPGCTAQLQTI